MTGRMNWERVRVEKLQLREKRKAAACGAGELEPRVTRLPRSLSSERVKCPDCGKAVAPVGLQQHRAAKHPNVRPGRVAARPPVGRRGATETVAVIPLPSRSNAIGLGQHTTKPPSWLPAYLVQRFQYALKVHGLSADELVCRAVEEFLTRDVRSRSADAGGRHAPVPAGRRRSPIR